MGTQTTRALIFGSAPCTSWGFLVPYLTSPFRVICADGGLLNARAAGLTPDEIIGDWDSGGVPDPDCSYTTLSPEKDMTDLQAAIELALSQNCMELLLCGCTGGSRLDHTASNLVLLEWIADKGGRAIIVDEDNEVHLLGPGTIVHYNSPSFRYFSLIPLDRKAIGVTLQGAKYPLNHACLTRGDTFSVSNEPTCPPVSITIEAGRALLICSERE